MKRIIKSKISRKISTLALLIAALVFTVPTDFTTRTIKADTCCSDCARERQQCYAICNDPETAYIGCYRFCIENYNYCLSTCEQCQ